MTELNDIRAAPWTVAKTRKVGERLLLEPWHSVGENPPLIALDSKSGISHFGDARSVLFLDTGTGVATRERHDEAPSDI